MKGKIIIFTIIFAVLAFLLYKTGKIDYLNFSDKEFSDDQKRKLRYSSMAGLLLNVAIGVLYIVKNSTIFSYHYFNYYIGTIIFTTVMFLIINFLIGKQVI